MKHLLSTVYFLLFFSCYIHAQKGIIKEIKFTGNQKTKSLFLKKIIKVKKGDTLDSLKIQTDIERVKRLECMAHADYNITSKDGDYYITYDLKENFSIIPGLRIGQANDDSFSYRVSLFDFNAFGRNITVGGFYQREVFNSYGFYLEHPYLLSNKWGLGLDYLKITTQEPMYTDDSQLNYNYTTQGPELIVFYEHNFNNRFEFGLKSLKKNYTIIPDDPLNNNVVNIQEPSINNQVVRSSFEYVDLDIAYHNISGIRNFLEASFFSDTNDLIQTKYIFTTNTQYFKRIGNKGNWANQFQIQYSNPVKNTNFTPITIDNQLNTRGAGNTVDRGTTSIALNTEYRHTLI